MGTLLNRRRVMGSGKEPYLEFEDSEFWRICCINWGDYNEVVTSINGDTTTISTTPVHMMFNTAKRGATATISRPTESEDVAGTVKEPIGITMKQCVAVGDIRTKASTIFSGNTKIRKMNELRFFINARVNNVSNPTARLQVFKCSNLEELTGNGYIAIDGYGTTNFKWAKNLSADLSSRFSRAKTFEYFTTPSGKNTYSENIRFVNEAALENCNSFLELIVLATTPPSIGTNYFSNTPSGLKIYVPDESVQAYKTAQKWSNWASKIYPISERPST